MITGPVKFDFYTNKVRRSAMAFWCVMIDRKSFEELGLLDEIFNPGTGEDADFCIKAEQEGHKLVQVPADGTHMFGDKFPQGPIYFPIMHLGGATFRILQTNPLITRNKKILDERYGTEVGISGPIVLYNDIIKTDCALFWCVMIKRKVIEEVGLLDEIFSPGGCEDLDFSMRAKHLGYTIARSGKIDYIGDKTDELAWAGTFPLWHKDSQTFKELGKEQYGEILHRNNHILQQKYNHYFKELTVSTKFSIVIPTYNHCDDLLKPCLESIIEHTDLGNVEVIVVANGCTDNTKEYVEGLQLQGFPMKLIWIPEAAGYTKSTNEGIKEFLKGTSEYVILLNNDTMLLPQDKNKWLEMLEAPFLQKELMGLAGPLELYDRYADAPVLIFFCVMIKRAVIETVGLLDEAFSPGGGEDIDFTVRARAAGFEAQVLHKTEYTGGTNIGVFPIWHKDNKTFVEIPEYTNFIVKRNGLINCLRYNKNIKLNLGSGGIDYPEYLSVDLNDRRAHILMDITKLEGFKDNSVTEILASHLFEHLNPYKSIDILREWLRVLIPGGRLIMEMPNIEELCRRFVTANYGERFGILNAVYGSVNTTDVGDPSQITSPHLFGWWPDSMYQHLMQAGYVDVILGPEKIPHPESNFRVEATKPIYNRADLLSQDNLTYNEIFVENSYQVLREEVEGKTVVDIGASIGIFSLRSIEMGAARVIAVEPQPNAFQGLLYNTSWNPKIEQLNKAVTDIDNQTVLISNAHVGSKVGLEGDPIQTISLLTIYNTFKITGPAVLKLDCEGSEYDIVMTAHPDFLRLFEVIYIEIHTALHSNPAYHGLIPINNKIFSSGFTLKHSLQQKWQAQQVPIDCFVQKWVRV